MQLSGVVFECRDAASLAAFYERLMGWKPVDEQADWVKLASPDGAAGLSFSTDPAYVPPVWPAQSGQQQMMMHLDIFVDDLDTAVAHARECGATEAEYQPQSGVRVMLDPDGHPFCLFIAGA